MIDDNPIHCDMPMKRWGKHRGKQRWKCMACGLATVNPYGKPQVGRKEINRAYYLRKKQQEEE